MGTFRCVCHSTHRPVWKYSARIGSTIKRFVLFGAIWFAPPHRTLIQKIVASDNSKFPARQKELDDWKSSAISTENREIFSCIKNHFLSQISVPAFSSCMYCISVRRNSLSRLNFKKTVELKIFLGSFIFNVLAGNFDTV